MTICIVKQMGLFYDVEKLFFFFFTKVKSPSEP